MRILVLLVMSLLVAELSFAGGNAPPSGNGRGAERCLAYDTGWDENGGDATCSACLQDHGNCEMRCYEYEYTCTYEGTSSEGVVNTYTVTRRRQRRADNKAQQFCYDAGNVTCAYKGCDENSMLTSTNMCTR